MFQKNLLRSSMLIALILPGMGYAASQSLLPHDHNDQHTLQLELNSGKKWQTDAALRQGMAAIYLQLSSAMPAIHQGEFPPSKLDDLSVEIEKQVAGIVSNCKLNAKADAQLHIIVAQLLKGSTQLTGKQPGSSAKEGVITVLDAISNYTRYFDDSALRHSFQH